MAEADEHIGAPDLEMPMEEEPTGALEVRLSERSDEKLFEDIATALATRFGGNWNVKADDADLRHWDLTTGGAIVSLRMERYKGIFLSAAEENEDLEKANQLVMEMAGVLRERVD